MGTNVKHKPSSHVKSLVRQMSLPTSPVSPVGQREEAALQEYFIFLSQFAFDKAKDIVEKERDIQKSAFGSSWALMVHSLIQFAVAEKTYMALGFLEQKWFRSSKDSLRNSYQVLMSEMRRMEESIRQQENLTLGLPGPTVDFELLLGHLCGQLVQFMMARQKTMEFYEQLSITGTNKNMSYDDLVSVVTAIITEHGRKFHHPILAGMKSGFTMECDIVNHLLQAQILMSSAQFLPSLLQLHQAHTKLTSWGSSAHTRETVKKGMFGSSSKTVTAWPQLYQWLLRYKGALMSKFSIYFNDSLSKQTIPMEMKALSAKNNEDYVAKIVSFHKKTDAFNVSLVLDTNSLDHVFKGLGYHHPDKQRSRPTGLDSYPAIFSFPGECPNNHWANVVMNLSDRCLENDKVHFFYDKALQSTYFITCADPAIYVVAIYETKKSEKDSYVNSFLIDLSSMLRCVKLFSNLRPGLRVGGSRK